MTLALAILGAVSAIAGAIRAVAEVKKRKARKAAACKVAKPHPHAKP